MRGIRHTGIVVSDLRKAMYFYRDLLGLKVKKKMHESGKYIDRICGIKKASVTTVKLAAEDGTLIELLYFHSRHGKSIKKEIYKTGISHIAFTVKDIDTQYKKLSKAGVKFYSSPQLSPDGFVKVVFCRDYEQNLIELVQKL